MWRRRKASRDTASAELGDLAASPTWMYEWDLGDGLSTVVINDDLMSVHSTRRPACCVPRCCR